MVPLVVLQTRAGLRGVQVIRRAGVPSCAVRARSLLVLATLIIGACASENSTEEALEQTTAARAFVEPSTTTSTTTTVPPTTTTTIAPALDFDGTARVLRTTTDVVVPVLEIVPEGFLVRTPCQDLAIIENGDVEERIHVVIDPGHGGSEPGAVTSDGVAEKDVNLQTALLVEERLEALGFEVTLTRYTDIRIPLATRVEIADQLEAALLVSIHHQGTDTNVPRSDTPGTEIYYQQTSSESKRFAGLLHEESIRALGVFDIEWFAGTDAGATYRPHRDTGEDFYGMVRLPETPSVLAEMAFLGNEAEVELLRSGELQAAEAEALTRAVTRWFSTDDPGSGFVEPSFGLLSSGGGGGLSGCSDPDLGKTVDVVADASG